MSFGESIPIYRDNVGDKGQWGQWEVGLQGGVFSIFDLGSDSFDLINTDFLAAGFVGYRYGDFSALGRIFHQSSHLGDELLLSDEPSQSHQPELRGPRRQAVVRSALRGARLWWRRISDRG